MKLVLWGEGYTFQESESGMSRPKTIKMIYPDYTEDTGTA